MQLDIFEILQDVDYSDRKVMIGLSGGINSAAALIYLAEKVDLKPDDIYLYYAHFDEHSEDTEMFVLDLVKYAKTKFKNVYYTQSDNSLIEYFRRKKMIPQPKITPCTWDLKINPMIKYMQENEIDVDIVGYVRSEWSRINRQIERGVKNKEYLIRHMSDEDCFSIVEMYIGWFPKLYTFKWNDKRIGKAIETIGHELNENQLNIIKQYYGRGYNFRRKSKRVFKHNNCLPCKNMHQWELFLLRIFYKEYYDKAMDLSKDIGCYWGRKNEEINEVSDCVVCSV